jgi:nucleotide-binding universal stress UspA family protein
MRLRRILVPLDGSAMAEAVLPAAGSLGQRLGARLLLLHVLERDPPQEVHGEPHLAGAGEAEEYLRGHADRLGRSGIAVDVHVPERAVGDVAAAIDHQAHELRADLIAMCAHGRGGLRGRVVGSIAERILRGGSIPILLRTVLRPQPEAFELRKLLVPIDFGHDVDAALSAARALAGPYQAAVVLLAVPEPPSPDTSRLLPGTSALLRELDAEDLRERLQALEARLRPDVGEVLSLVDERAPPDAILAAAEALPADLLVVVTDAHGGLSRWYDRSTAQRLLDRPAMTLLLIREL